MAMWVSVNDTNSLAPVTDAFFSVGYHNAGSGNYYVLTGPNQVFWVDSPAYRVQYANSDAYSQMQVSLTRDVWP
jgi:hypothetical protein